MIDNTINDRLYTYIGGIIREFSGTLIEINAMPVRIKNNFGWQDGYGAFSVSKSSESAVIQYIRNQQNHHRERSFQEEFIDMLNKYCIEYDENYIWK